MNKDVINLLNEHNISECLFYFETDYGDFSHKKFEFPEKNLPYNVKEILINFFNEEILKKVEFLQPNSEYIGEFGVVKVKVENDNFSFIKETNERKVVNSQIFLDLTNEEFDFISNNVTSIHGSSFNDPVFKFINNLITLSDSVSEMIESLSDKIQKVTSDFLPENYKMENLDDWYEYEFTSTDIIDIYNNVICDQKSKEF